MNGRWLAPILLLGVPAVLIGITVYMYSSNPVSIMALIGVMGVGGLYLVTYLHDPF